MSVNRGINVTFNCLKEAEFTCYYATLFRGDSNTHLSAIKKRSRYDYYTFNLLWGDSWTGKYTNNLSVSGVGNIVCWMLQWVTHVWALSHSSTSSRFIVNSLKLSTGCIQECGKQNISNTKCSNLVFDKWTCQFSLMKSCNKLKGETL